MRNDTKSELLSEVIAASEFWGLTCDRTIDDQTTIYHHGEELAVIVVGDGGVMRIYPKYLFADFGPIAELWHHMGEISPTVLGLGTEDLLLANGQIYAYYGGRTQLYEAVINIRNRRFVAHLDIRDEHISYWIRPCTER